MDEVSIRIGLFVYNMGIELFGYMSSFSNKSYLMIDTVFFKFQYVEVIFQVIVYHINSWGLFY